jgi:hypothetical protein
LAETQDRRLRHPSARRTANEGGRAFAASQFSGKAASRCASGRRLFSILTLYWALQQSNRQLLSLVVYHGWGLIKPRQSRFDRGCDESDVHANSSLDLEALPTCDQAEVGLGGISSGTVRPGEATAQKQRTTPPDRAFNGIGSIPDPVRSFCSRARAIWGRIVQPYGKDSGPQDDGRQREDDGGQLPGRPVLELVLSAKMWQPIFAIFRARVEGFVDVRAKATCIRDEVCEPGRPRRSLLALELGARDGSPDKGKLSWRLTGPGGFIKSSIAHGEFGEVSFIQVVRRCCPRCRACASGRGRVAADRDADGRGQTRPGRSNLLRAGGLGGPHRRACALHAWPILLASISRGSCRETASELRSSLHFSEACLDRLAASALERSSSIPTADALDQRQPAYGRRARRLGRCVHRAHPRCAGRSRTLDRGERLFNAVDVAAVNQVDISCCTIHDRHPEIPTPPWHTSGLASTSAVCHSPFPCPRSHLQQILPRLYW